MERKDMSVHSFDLDERENEILVKLAELGGASIYQLEKESTLSRGEIHRRLRWGLARKKTLIDRDYVQRGRPSGVRGRKKIENTFKGKVAAFSFDVSNQRVSEALKKHSNEFGFKSGEAFLAAIELLFRWLEKLPKDFFDHVPSDDLKDRIGAIMYQGVFFSLTEILSRSSVGGMRKWPPMMSVILPRLDQWIGRTVSSEERAEALVKHLAHEDFLSQSKFDLFREDWEIKSKCGEDLPTSAYGLVEAGCLILPYEVEVNVYDAIVKGPPFKLEEIRCDPIITFGKCPDEDSCSLENSEKLTCDKVRSDLKKLKRR